VAGSCDHENEVSASIRGGDSLDKLSNGQLLKKDSSVIFFKLRPQQQYVRRTVGVRRV
jgi:hypothetical protein